MQQISGDLSNGGASFTNPGEYNKEANDRYWGAEMFERSLDEARTLPSEFQVLQVVYVRLRQGDYPFTGTVRAVKFNKDKAVYDIGIWLGDGTNSNPERETLISELDAEFITRV